MNIPGAFVDVDLLFNRHTEKVLPATATSGRQTALMQPVPTANIATGLANDSTAYTATVKVDGTDRAVSVVGSAAQTFGTLITEINADISTWATAELGLNGIRISSLSTGGSSKIAITDITLFAALTKHFVKFAASVDGKTTYLRWNKLDEAVRTELKAIMDAVDTTSVAWAQGTDGLQVASVTARSALGLTAGSYDLNVNVDGAGATNVTFVVKAGMTYGDLVDDVLTPALAAASVAAKVSMVADTIVFTSNSYGVASSVALTAGSSADVIAALSATNIANAVAGSQIVVVGGNKVSGTASGLTNDSTAYTATIVVDGVSKPISVVGSAAQTFGTLISEINVDLGVAATAALVSGNIKVTSATTGRSSTVAITAGTLFASPLAGFASVSTAVAGTSTLGFDGSSTMTFPKTYGGVAYADWKLILQSVKSPTGYGVFNVLNNKALADRRSKPRNRTDCVNTRVYFDGTNWKYFSNDVTLAANSVNPPEF